MMFMLRLFLFVSLFFSLTTAQSRTTTRLTLAPNDEAKPFDSWRYKALGLLWQERLRMKHTPIFTMKMSGYPNTQIIWKNESASRTWSLKHRYAWALMTWAVMEGFVTQNTTVYEASSGNTACSEAYMAQLIGVNFTAIVPDTIEDAKTRHITQFGATVIKADIGMRLKIAAAEAEKNGGFFMNQFANADKAEEFHESGTFVLEGTNVMSEILKQLNFTFGPDSIEPNYFVHSAGTGGTISSVGRYLKKHGIPTQMVLADTQYSVYHDYVIHGAFSGNESGADQWKPPGISGTGFGPMGPVNKGQSSSMSRVVIDRSVKVPDLLTVAGIHVLKDILKTPGGNTCGLNLVVAMHLAATEKKTNPNKKIQIVTLLADSHTSYETSYLNLTWVADNFADHGLKRFQCYFDYLVNCTTTGDDPLNANC